MTETEAEALKAARIVTNRYGRKFPSVPRDELLSEAYLASAVALDVFDPSKGSVYSLAYECAKKAVIRFASRWIFGSSVVLEQHQPVDPSYMRFVTLEHPEWVADSDKPALSTLGKKATAEEIAYIGFEGVENARLVRALKTLKPNYRDLLKALLIDGKTYREISEATGRRVYFLQRQYKCAINQLSEALSHG